MSRKVRPDERDTIDDRLRRWPKNGLSRRARKALMHRFNNFFANAGSSKRLKLSDIGKN